MQKFIGTTTPAIMVEEGAVAEEATHTGGRITSIGSQLFVGGTEVSTDLRALRANRCDIVVATPGRLDDLMSRGALKVNELEMLILDEADRLLDMGFQKALDRILSRWRPHQPTRPHQLAISQSRPVSYRASAVCSSTAAV